VLRAYQPAISNSSCPTSLNITICILMGRAEGLLRPRTRRALVSWTGLRTIRLWLVLPDRHETANSWLRSLFGFRLPATVHAVTIM
jgi:hypothetical protein